MGMVRRPRCTEPLSCPRRWEKALPSGETARIEQRAGTASLGSSDHPKGRYLPCRGPALAAVNADPSQLAQPQGPAGICALGSWRTCDAPAGRPWDAGTPAWHQRCILALRWGGGWAETAAAPDQHFPPCGCSSLAKIRICPVCCCFLVRSASFLLKEGSESGLM